MRYSTKALSTVSTIVALLSPVACLAQGYGGTPADYSGANSYTPPPQPSYPPAQPLYVPAGMMLHASLQTSIATEAARSGDSIQASLSQPVMLGSGQLPAGTVLEGHVTEAKAGGFLGRSGELTIHFDTLRVPGTMPVPMSAHIAGNIGKYKMASGNNGTIEGEGAGTKVGQALLRTAIGAGTGAALGTAVGAIAGAGRPNLQYQTTMMPERTPFGGVTMMPVGYYRPTSGAATGAGRGAWSGAAIGGGAGLADSLLLRKGTNVDLKSGTLVELQLDGPIQLSHPYGVGQI